MNRKLGSDVHHYNVRNISSLLFSGFAFQYIRLDQELIDGLLENCNVLLNG